MTQRPISAQVYLDNNASAPPLPEVVDAMAHALTRGFGNPSSAHSLGDKARDLVEAAREEIARLIGGSTVQLVFTSGGTEANNLAISSALHDGPLGRIVTSPIEHSSVIKHCQHLEQLGTDVVWLGVDDAGRIDPSELARHLKSKTDLVSLQWINNETGVIQPVNEVAAICAAHCVPFHCDAAQAVGKLPMDIDSTSFDFLSFTAHKIHGPQGIGALYRKSVGPSLKPMLHGGQQESGHRPGTENVSGIAGFGTAARIRRERLSDWIVRVGAIRDRFERALFDAIPGIAINGGAAERVCNTSNVYFDGIDGTALLARLDQRGVLCSQSSACTNRRPEPSYVLRAMGLSEDEAYASVRFSFSELNSEMDVDYAINVIVESITALRQFSGSSIFAA